jgi:prevent-host-death family protein
MIDDGIVWSCRYDHVCYNLSMRKIGAAEFKAHCLTLMEDVRSTREPLIITKRGKPVAKLVPVDNKKDNWIGRLNGKIRIVGDIESPVVPLEDWEVLR